MLRKNSKIAFAGMRVFPGGRIDVEDGADTEDMEQRARIAAAREAMEEAALGIDPASMCWFSHWTPPALNAQEPRYYATHVGQSGDDLEAMWAGDAGYESGEADTPGPRHRLHMGSGGFEFDGSGIN